MSRVHKCDICGEIYGDYPNGTERFAVISIMSAKPEFHNVFGEDEYDCCPECTENILSLIDCMKTYPRQWVITIAGEEV